MSFGGRSPSVQSAIGAGLESVLIIKMSSIGDVVHALPVASSLRRRYPSVRLTWVVEEWVAPLVAGHAALDRVVVFPAMRWGAVSPRWVRSFAAGVRALRQDRYDLAVDLQSLLKSSVVSLLSGARTRIGMHRQREGASLVSQAVRPRTDRTHVVDEYLACAEFLDAPTRPVSFDLPVRREAARSVERLLSAAVSGTRPLVVVSPSSSSAARSWTTERWSLVVEALAGEADVVVAGTRSQRRRHAEIVRDSLSPVVDLTGLTGVAELVALLDRCALHVAPDSGSAHIAAALGRPVVGVYGPTSPSWKAPHGQGDLVVYGGDRCGRTCPRLCLRKRRCLDAVSAEEVIARCRSALLAGRPKEEPPRPRAQGRESLTANQV